MNKIIFRDHGLSIFVKLLYKMVQNEETHLKTLIIFCGKRKYNRSNMKLLRRTFKNLNLAIKLHN